MNREETNVTQEENEENITVPEEIVPHKLKRKYRVSRFYTGSNFGLGLLTGIIGAITLAVVGPAIYCHVTGTVLMIGNRGANVVSGGDSVLNREAAHKVDELVNYMKLYYYEDYNEEDIRNGMYAGVLEGLDDKYSVYYTADEYARQQISVSGTYYGIGAGLSQDKDTMEVTITKIYEGTPSEEAGLLEDDIIMSVDGTDATSMELEKLVQMIRGEEGTKVKLHIYRPSTREELDFEVERKDVELPSVEGKYLGDGIGYIQISEFQKKTGDQFEQIVKELDEQGMTAMIVDVRSNPGGMLTSVVQILDDILPEGIVVYTQNKYGERQDYTSDAKCMKYPMAVLTNGNSASASEIFAGAIKDYEYGTLIGTKTFGKGIVQSILPLEDGDAIKLTTSKYYTPNGNYIHGVGIEPDVELDYKFTGPEGSKYDVKFDNQIQKAIEVLKK